MGKNQSASNLTNIIKQDASGNISFVSGSTTLMSVSSSGTITTTGNGSSIASVAATSNNFLLNLRIFGFTLSTSSLAILIACIVSLCYLYLWQESQQ